MATPEGFHNAGFICGLQNEARCLTAAGVQLPIAVSGARTARAAEVARELLAAGAEALVSIGLAGGLDPRLGPGSIVVAERVIVWHQPLPKRHRRNFRLGLGTLVRHPAEVEADMEREAAAPVETVAEFVVDPELNRRLLGVLGKKTWSGAIVGVDQAVRTPDQKLALFTRTGALACDMESHAVAEVARSQGVPFAVLRIVSDPSNRFIPDAALAGITAAGEVSSSSVLRSVAARPWEILELFSLALDARIAFGVLRRVARRSAPLFRAVG